MAKNQNGEEKLAPVEYGAERPVDEFAKTPEEEMAALRRNLPDENPEYGKDLYRPPVEGPESIERKRELKRQLWEAEEKAALKQIKAEAKEQESAPAEG